MSAPASSPAEIKPSSRVQYPSMELVRLAPRWQDGLTLFLAELKECGDELFFSPHPVDEISIGRVAGLNGKDLYYLLVEGEKVLGYGLLRGWDEGYSIPSLGVAIHPAVRGAGLGKLFMNFLHAMALQRGARKVRLRVNKNNSNAQSLYMSLGYVFETDANQAGYLIGFKNLG